MMYLVESFDPQLNPTLRQADRTGWRIYPVSILHRADVVVKNGRTLVSSQMLKYFWLSADWEVPYTVKRYRVGRAKYYCYSPELVEWAKRTLDSSKPRNRVESQVATRNQEIMAWLETPSIL